MRIWIDTNNDAFQPTPEEEVIRILRDLADRIYSAGLPPSGDPRILRDYNGNMVGGYCNSSDALTDEQWRA